MHLRDGAALRLSFGLDLTDPSARKLDVVEQLRAVAEIRMSAVRDGHGVLRPHQSRHSPGQYRDLTWNSWSSHRKAPIPCPDDDVLTASMRSFGSAPTCTMNGFVPVLDHGDVSTHAHHCRGDSRPFLYRPPMVDGLRRSMYAVMPDRGRDATHAFSLLARWPRCSWWDSPSGLLGARLGTAINGRRRIWQAHDMSGDIGDFGLPG